MNTKKTKPKNISRSDSSKSSFSFLDKSLSNSFDEPNPSTLKKPSSPPSTHSNLLLPQSSFNNYYNIFKTDSTIMPELLAKYSQANLLFRDEAFTQQSEAFLAKIATDKRIPKDFQAKFPLYQIFTSVCKIFMLNEYEIVVLSCTLDHSNWKLEEVINPNEGSLLNEFPANFTVEISEECRRFIIYLLIVTFSLKQYLNEKAEIDPIQAYCEKICTNFQMLYNRWNNLSSVQKFTYSAVEINKKFKYLSKPEYNRVSAPKDYNSIVDSIVALTAPYNFRRKVEMEDSASPEQPQPQPQRKAATHDIPEIFYDEAPSHSPLDSRTLFAANDFTRGLNKGLLKQLTFESVEDLKTKIPDSQRYFERQGSISQLLTNFSVLRNNRSYEPEDKELRKKVKLESTTVVPANLLTLRSQESSNFEENLGSQEDTDDMLNLNLDLKHTNKKASSRPQKPDEEPSSFKINSKFSLF